MKKIVWLVALVLVAATIFVFAKETKKSEAEVTWSKKGEGTTYKIVFDKEYKINKSAPFKFSLLDKEKKEIYKVDWSMFKEESGQSYLFVSDKSEKFAKYWFVACKYKNSEIVSCKTFSNTVEIK
ncbi:MAG: hypothetical protein ACOX2F_12945 [bacterium]